MQRLELRRIGGQTHRLPLHRQRGGKRIQQAASERNGGRLDEEVGRSLGVRDAFDGVAGVVLADIFARRRMVIAVGKAGVFQRAVLRGWQPKCQQQKCYEFEDDSHAEYSVRDS